MTVEEFIKHCDSLNENAQFENNLKGLKQYNSVVFLMKKFSELKCGELLDIVTEKAMIIEDNDVQHKDYYLDLGGILKVDKDSILNCVDLETFCS